jgi:hypothetical protein
MTNIKQKKPTHTVGFAIGSPVPIPPAWIGDQTGQWIIASVMTQI